MEFIIALIFGIGFLFFFNWWMGYKQDHIILDFEESNVNQDDYINAILKRLESQGRSVKYMENGRFIVDEKRYMFMENEATGEALQRTVLKPEK
ncbi:hypothetical protein [Sutcliffiella deserti]|uniref:hypothetical protein n=1 Tax=Sutcliffiella deserti TaxID=2875501 RepID=UPI001CBDE13D|nr:hypothetical protein [Sutcliffiella deserti]